MNLSKPSIKRIEMKFQLDPSLADQVRDWARAHLGVDENCGVESGDTYDINTLYLDTAELDLFHRTGEIGTCKHRIRRYGEEQALWIETKRKRKMVVRKNRTAVYESDLMPRLQNILPPATTEVATPIPSQNATTTGETAVSGRTAPGQDAWCGDWFLDRVTDRRLHPALLIGYRRFARTSMLDGENLRLTIDSHMTASPIDGWRVASTSQDRVEERFPFGDFEILELKFHNHMPNLFKELLRTFTIPATGFSKYRTAMRSHFNACRPPHATKESRAASPKLFPSESFQSERDQEGVKYA